MPLILPGNVASATAAVGYDVANSCRFETNAYMGRTPGTASGSGTKATFSCWFKTSFIPDSDTALLTIRNSSTTSMFNIGWSGGGLWVGVLDSASYAGSVSTARLFRDPSAWYHIVVAYDTTQATSTDRIKIYINGTRETVFTYNTFPSEDHANGALTATTGYTQQLCSYTFGGGSYFYGYVAEAVFCDGQALAATSFGEFDSDSPTIWKPIDVSELTFGDQGFYLDFEASGNLGNDANGGTDWAESNLAAADQATDTPTNNFCTMNPLDNYIAAATFSEGNCNLVHPSSSNNAFCTSTFWLSSGKWYAEAKVSTSAGSDNNLIGISSVVSPSADNAGSLGQTTSNYSYLGDGGGYRYNNSTTSYGSAYGVNAVIGVYLDLDNNKLYFAEDGTIQASGTGISITAAASQPSGLYTISGGDWSSGTGVQWSWNFGGCPAFAISSGNADAEGYGNFEYSPNDGGSSSFDSAAKNFLAICTKNLAEYGG